MGQKRLGIDPELLRMCEEAGVALDVVRKRRHISLVIGGRQVLVVPHNNADHGGRARDNARCHLKRHLRSLQPCPA